MKATGIVRRIDDLGRVVIPKEIRRTLRIREGDPLEIFTDREGEVILKKYSPIGELGDFAREYAESLYQSLKCIICVSDKDTVIAVSGGPRKEFIERTVSYELEQVMESKKSHSQESGGVVPVVRDDRDIAERYKGQIIVPIISEGDAIGSVILLSRDEPLALTGLEHKVAETAAGFLGKQMEQ